VSTATAGTHLEPVMGTVVGITGAVPLPATAIGAAVAVLHDADRVFSLWDASSPMSRLRRADVGRDDLDPADAAAIAEVLARCAVVREVTGGAFDPWAMPGGTDPTGLVKGWAAARALHALAAHHRAPTMINAGGDIAVTGPTEQGPWRIGVRHPGQPGALAAVVEVAAAIATSADYERPGQLIDPATGRTARVAASATVVGPELDLADALATGLAVGGTAVLAAIDALPGYEGYLITDAGRHYATPGLPFAEPSRAR
jgi:thiamine biosynthesis lipoprotein